MSANPPGAALALPIVNGAKPVPATRKRTRRPSLLSLAWKEASTEAVNCLCDPLSPGLVLAGCPAH